MLSVESITSREDLEQAPTADLLGLYNHITGRSTTKFSSRKRGVEQVWALVKDKVRKPVPKPIRPGVRRKTFRLAPKAREEQKNIRPNTKRRILFDLTSRPEGALFSELQELCGWSEKDNYEGLRLLHVWCGYGLWSEDEGDDYRIWLCHTMSEWREKIDASKQKQEKS